MVKLLSGFPQGSFAWRHLSGRAPRPLPDGRVHGAAQVRQAMRGEEVAEDRARGLAPSGRVSVPSVPLSRLFSEIGACSMFLTPLDIGEEEGDRPGRQAGHERLSAGFYRKRVLDGLLQRHRSH